MIGGTPSYKGALKRKGGYPHIEPVIDLTEKYFPEFSERVMKPFLTTDLLCCHFAAYPQNKRTSKCYSWELNSTFQHRTQPKKGEKREKEE
jgi:hypothetical protein